MVSLARSERSFNSVTAYINAGGRGTRLNSTFRPDPEYGIAKALLEVGAPSIKLVDHHINRLGSVAFRNIVVGAGDLSSVAAHVQDRYECNTVVDAFSTNDHSQLGTGGDLIVALRSRPELFGTQILINNVDTILDLDNVEFVRRHLGNRSNISIALTTKNGVPNEGAFMVDADEKVLYSAESTVNIRSMHEAKEQAEYSASSTGALIVESEFLRSIEWSPSDGQLSLYKDIMSAALKVDSVAAFNNGMNFFVDVGTDATWQEYAYSEAVQKQLWYDTKNSE